MPPFNKRIRYDASDLTALRAELGAWLEAEQLPAQAAFEVKLLAHEAASNAAAHVKPGGNVLVTATVAGAEVVIEIVDPSAEPWALNVPASEDELTGLQLINGLTRTVKAIPLRQGAALVMQVPRS